VSSGHHVVLVTAEHEVGPAARRAGDKRPRPITIEDGCWIGARTTILPGVRIGASSVVAAGSLVAADVPPCKVVGGVPARVLKSLPEAP
jgi:acetyltransferase-like isoleucine patch superfamily enzyme